MDAIKEVFAILSILVLMFPTQAATYYVSPGGNDDANGLTWPTAFKTINHGIVEADNGDIVEVNQGTYYETINFDGKAIILTGRDPISWDTVEATIIDSNGFGNTVTFNHSEDACSVLKGFTIRGSGSGINCSGSAAPIIKRCIITDNNTTGIQCADSGTAPAIINNIIKDNGVQGILCQNSASPIVKNNLIQGNAYGLYTSMAGSVIVRNNTIVNNTAGGVNNGGGTAPAVSNCIIWNCNDDLYDCNAAYSCIQDGDSGTGNIGSDPCFVNAGSNDFHLKSTSPCIDAGDPADTYDNEADLDGFPRVSICESLIWKVDMGVYEYRYDYDANSCFAVGGECAEDAFPVSLEQWRIFDPEHYGWQNISSSCINDYCFGSFSATFKVEDRFECGDPNCWDDLQEGTCEVNIITTHEQEILYVEVKGRTERGGDVLCPGCFPFYDHGAIFVDGERVAFIEKSDESINCETGFHRDFAAVTLWPGSHNVQFMANTFDGCNNSGVYFEFTIKTYNAISLIDGQPCACLVECSSRYDSDSDGMPDEWELAVCLNPYNSNDRIGDRNGDGNINIEEYLDWLASGESIPANTDINCDDIVNFEDFSEFAGHWGSVSGDTSYSGRYDFGHNRKITMDDLFYFAQDWLTAGREY